MGEKKPVFDPSPPVSGGLTSFSRQFKRLGGECLDFPNTLLDYYELFACQAVADEVLYPLRVLGMPVAAAERFQTWLGDGHIILALWDFAWEGHI